MYTYILRALAPNGILPVVKFTLRPSLAFSCFGSVTARHSSSGHQRNFAAWDKEWTALSQRAPPIFGRAAITLGMAHILDSVYNNRDVELSLIHI